MRSGSSYEVVVLAGGKSKRFGADKCSHEWNGVKLLERVVRSFHELNIEPIVVTDRRRGFKNEVLDNLLLGPFTAVKTVVNEMKIRKVFVTGCDYPFIDPKLPQVLCSLDYEAVVPVYGIPHYLLGCYNSSVFLKDCSSFKGCLDSPYYISHRELSYYKISTYTFLNVNYPRDLILSPTPSLIRDKGF